MRATSFPAFALWATLVFTLMCSLSCHSGAAPFVIALDSNISTLDPVGATTVDAASERVRVLLFDSLVRKDDNFDYVPDLAASMQSSDDGTTLTFELRDGVKFHDGRPLTSKDVKYTLDTLLASNGGKAASFYEATGADRKPYFDKIETPDDRRIVLHLLKPWLQRPLLSNLVSIGIIPEGTAAAQKDHPLGSGPFKFVRFDSTQQVLDLEVNENYWRGASQIRKLRVRVISDPNALQAELRAGRVDCAPAPVNLTPDTIELLKQDPRLAVEQFPGANIVYLGFNTESAPLNDVRVRQAISYAIDREGIIRDLLLNQARLAHSILPEGSWAYSPGHTYSYDPAKARQLLDQAGFPDPDGDGPKMRFASPLMFKIASSSAATRHYAEVIQNSLKAIGVPVEIQTLEGNTLLGQLQLGQYQMTTSRWVGGNQDPLFYRDLFASSEIPTESRPSRNRSRYRNPELDRILEEARETVDRERARALYIQVQEIVSRDVPMLPLWYPAIMVVNKKSVGNVKVKGDGDWEFVRNLTVSNK